MPGLRETLEAATPGGKPPYRIAGIPAGIISADDYDVTDDALAFLALAPELAALVLDAAQAGICRRFTASWCRERPEISEEDWCAWCKWLARLDQLGKEEL